MGILTILFFLLFSPFHFALLSWLNPFIYLSLFSFSMSWLNPFIYLSLFSFSMSCHFMSQSLLLSPPLSHQLFPLISIALSVWLDPLWHFHLHDNASPSIFNFFHYHFVHTKYTICGYFQTHSPIVFMFHPSTFFATICTLYPVYSP